MALPDSTPALLRPVIGLKRYTLASLLAQAAEDHMQAAEVLRHAERELTVSHGRGSPIMEGLGALLDDVTVRTGSTGLGSAAASGY